MQIVISVLGGIAALFFLARIFPLILLLSGMLLSACANVLGATFSVLLLVCIPVLAAAFLANLYGEIGGIGLVVVVLVSYLIGKWPQARAGTLTQATTSVKSELGATALGFLALFGILYRLSMFTVMSWVASFLLFYGVARIFGHVNGSGQPVTSIWLQIYVPMIAVVSVLSGGYFSFKHLFSKNGPSSGLVSNGNFIE